MGNLVQVTEPNPAGGANFETYYAYDALNNLTQVAHAPQRLHADAHLRLPGQPGHFGHQPGERDDDVHLPWRRQPGHAHRRRGRRD